MKAISLFLFFILSSTLIAQNAVVKGTVKDANKNPIKGVAVSYANHGTTTNNNGEYQLTIPANVEITIIFSHISYNSLFKKVLVPKNKTLRFSPSLETKVENITEVIVKDKKKMLKDL